MLKEQAERREAWVRAPASGKPARSQDPLRLRPVLRVYDAEGEGMTFDLRTGMLTPGKPTEDDLRAWLLSQLPLPPELRLEVRACGGPGRRVR